MILFYIRFIDKGDFMKKSFKIVLSLAIGGLASILFIYAAPSFIRTTISSENKVAYEQPIPSIAHGFILSQQFIPQYDRIGEIEVYINSLNCNRNQGYISTCISDANMNTIYNNRVPLTELPEYGLTSVADNVILHAGETYYFTIEAIDTLDDGPLISFYPTMTAASTEENSFQLTYANMPLENSVLRTVFHYSVGLPAINYFVYCIFSVC